MITAVLQQVDQRHAVCRVASAAVKPVVLKATSEAGSSRASTIMMVTNLREWTAHSSWLRDTVEA